MAVLHELLAVEQSLAATANRVTKEVTKVLDSKKSLFEGMSKEHTIFNEAEQHLAQATEYKEVQSTVDEQLDFLGAQLGNYWDVVLQKEEANQRSFADIIVAGTVIAEKVPSIVLLGMETKLNALLEVYNAIPTLDAARAWIPDEANAKPNVFRTNHTVERQHTVTTKKFIEVSAATVQHKAQIAEQEATEVIGKYTVTDFSGAISSANKAAKLEKLTALIRGVKAARQRANNTDVQTELTIGKALLDFING